MRKALLSLLVVVSIFSTAVFADGTALPADLNTDADFTAFTSDSDSSLDGWRGYTKNTDGTIDAASWYTFTATKRIVGNVLANMPESWQDTGSPSPTGNVFYTAQNFGTEYNFSGDFYNFQNSSYVYFNTAISEQDGRITAKSGYRLHANRAQKTIELQKASNSSWITLESAETESWTWTYCHFNITFAEGVITANVTHSNIFDVTLRYDASSDADYVDTGYIGFGASAGKITVGKVHVGYNSGKVYVMPSLRDTNELFKGYSIVPGGQEVPFTIWVDMRRANDVRSCSFYVDNAFMQEMEQNGDTFSAAPIFAEKGTHTAKVVLADRYGNETEIASTTFFVSDFTAYPAVYTNAGGEVINRIAESDGSATVTFKINPANRSFSAITVYAAKYDENGKLIAVYPNKILNPAANTDTEISVTVPDILNGQSITAFLFEDYSKPAPLSGGFTLK